MLYYLCTIDSSGLLLSVTPANLLVDSMATKSLIRILCQAVVGVVAVSSDKQNEPCFMSRNLFLSLVRQLFYTMYQLAFRVKLMFTAVLEK